MKLNRKWILIMSLVLSVAIATGSTLAYMTATTTPITNTFTLGNVSITLTEPKWDADDADHTMYPGAEVVKDPTITNTGRTPAWVWMEVAIPTTLAEYIELAMTTGWSIDDTLTKVVGSNSVFTLKRSAQLAAQTAEAAFTAVTLSEDVPDTVLAGFDADGVVEITVTGYAIQDKPFENIDKAYDAYHGGTGDESDEEATGQAVTTAEALASALNAGGAVYLDSDVTVSSTMTVPAGVSSKIHLNGHNLSYAVTNDGASAIINNKGTLVLAGNGTISYVAASPDMQEIPAYATNTITTTGDLTIGKGVTIANGSDGGASYAVDVTGGKFTMNGGTLRGNRCALRVAEYTGKGTEFVMNDGLITANTPAWIQLAGSDASKAPSINVTINGGTIQTTKAASDANDLLYTYSFGNSHANTSLTITGGKFVGGTVSIGSGYYGDAPALNITGGKFDYDVLKWTAAESSTVVYEAN